MAADQDDLESLFGDEPKAPKSRAWNSLQAPQVAFGGAEKAGLLAGFLAGAGRLATQGVLPVHIAHFGVGTVLAVAVAFAVLTWAAYRFVAGDTRTVALATGAALLFAGGVALAPVGIAVASIVWAVTRGGR